MLWWGRCAWGAIAQIYLQLRGERMMMAGGGGAAMDHNGIYSNPNLHTLQQTQLEADNPDSRKRPLETPAEEAGCTKRTNTGGKRYSIKTSSSAVSLPLKVQSVTQAFAHIVGSATAKKCSLQQQPAACTETTCSTEADSGRTLGCNMRHLCTWHFETLSSWLLLHTLHIPAGRAGRQPGSMRAPLLSSGQLWFRTQSPRGSASGGMLRSSFKWKSDTLSVEALLMTKERNHNTALVKWLSSLTGIPQ